MFRIDRYKILEDKKPLYMQYNVFVKDLLQRKYVQHVQGQITELLPSPIWINIYRMTKVK